MLEWLKGLNLEMYADTFRTYGIDGAYLREGIDDITLNMLQVKIPAHRQKLTSKIQELFA